MIKDAPLRFGLFMAPFHPVGESPNVSIHNSLDLITHLDDLGYDEVWIGEHHTGGWETITAPEVMIATAAERTRRIKLGTGVSTVGYHHPLTLVERLALLDHVTRGRAMLGLGAGSLVYDAAMFGVDPMHLRRRLAEGLEAVMALLTEDEPVSRETDWFVMKDAYLQLRPYTHPHMEVAVAGFGSPAGPQSAGRYGISLLSIGATTTQGYEALVETWRIAEEAAAESNRTVERQSWRVVAGPMHIAETEEQAQREVEHGLSAWVDFSNRVSTAKLLPDAGAGDDLAHVINNSGVGVIGTPDMAIKQIRRLVDRSGGFGTVLLMDHEWADRDATRRSYELIARKVMPEFQGTVRPLRFAFDRAVAAHAQLAPLGRAAREKATTDYKEKRSARV